MRSIFQPRYLSGMFLALAAFAAEPAEAQTMAQAAPKATVLTQAQKTERLAGFKLGTRFFAEHLKKHGMSKQIEMPADQLKGKDYEFLLGFTAGARCIAVELDKRKTPFAKADQAILPCDARAAMAFK